MQIFDRKLLKKRKNNSFSQDIEDDFLKNEVISRLLERLDEVKQSFARGLNIGAEMGSVANNLHMSSKVEKLFQTDISLEALKKNSYQFKINMDEENLCFKDGVFDLVISPFSLQNSNDLQGILYNIHRIMKKGGLFIGSMPTIGTLGSLEEAFFNTEMELYSGVSPRVHPFSDVKTIGNLLQNAKFSEIVVDSDRIDIMYKDFDNIFKDLKTWGNTNILLKRDQKILKKAFFQKLKDNFEKFKDAESGCYPIRIEFCNFMAWKV